MGGAKYYIISIYFKYILINILIFIGLIWISQILRILELQYSVSNQMISVVKTTSLVLPSFINPLMPFLLMLASFFINYRLNSNNEILIIKQYLSVKHTSSLLVFLTFVLLVSYAINNEFFSIKTYHKYKIEELKIRNNLKLGIPSQNEFHIDDEVSIFFGRQIDDTFYDIEALIYKEGQLIKSNTAEIEISKKSFNLVFKNGERLVLNKDEKSKTNFDKFTYSIENKSVDLLMMDKEHFNTLQLLKQEELKYRNHGHNRFYQYLLLFVVILSSFKIIFLYEPKKNLIKKFGLIFLSLLMLQILNSYFLYELNNRNLILINYYVLNISLITGFTYFLMRIIK